MIAYWQFTLLMQLFEGIAWLQLRSVAPNISSTSRTLMVLNVMQPIVLTATVWFGYGRVPAFALVATFMYSLLVLTEADVLWRESESVRPTPDCPHLDLRYWNGARTTLYYFASFFSFVSIPSLLWAVVNGLIFTVTLLIAVGAYHCGGGSMWCWLIFVAGAVLVLVDRGVRYALGPKSHAIFEAQRVSVVLRERRLFLVVTDSH